jgi:drug/metabolite transporter (DMT)-like permease
MAMLSSMFYGVADFMGGMGSRRAHVVTVTAWFQLVGVVFLVGYALFAPGVTRPSDLAWAAAAGVCGGLGVTLLYHVLAIGTVSTAAPLVSMIALTVPVAVGLLRGERPGVLPLVGIALGALAVWLVSGDGSHGEAAPGAPAKARSASASRALLLAVLAGVLIGGFLVLLAHVQPGSSGWPLVAGRMSATLCLWALVAIQRAPVPLPAPARAPMLAAAFTDVVGNVLYLLAVQRAPMSLMATLVSLAPATTVLLAQVVLRERLSGRQKVGVALALVAVTLISRGGAG